jgi:hypothetical protein
MPSIPLLRKVSGSNRWRHSLKFAVVAYTEVSDRDFKRLNRHQWLLHTTRLPSGQVYRHAMRRVGDVTVFMHQVILGIKPGQGHTMEGHHRDNNGLNNCRENLQALTNAEHQKTHVI